jgi:hypothetical protein
VFQHLSFCLKPIAEVVAVVTTVGKPNRVGALLNLLL